MKGTVYILRNSLGKLYVGSTDNLERRLKQHNDGHTQTTRNMGKVVLVFRQDLHDLKTARKIERRIKS